MEREPGNMPSVKRTHEIRSVHEHTDRVIGKEEILEMKPRELRDHCIALEERSELGGFLEQAAADPDLVAQLSYWEKWFAKDQQRLLDEIITRKQELYPGNKESLPLDLEKRFSPQELEIIFSNIGAIQLTFGCSKGCPFCGLDAAPGVREYIPYPQLASLFSDYGRDIHKSHPLLYWASEPSDYVFEDKTYEDINELAVRHADYTPYVSSKETADPAWLKFLNLKGGSRVSLFGQSAEKASQLSEQFPNIEKLGAGKQHMRGIGSSSMESGIAGESIACFDGTLLTPRGLYNLIQIDPTEQYPQGLLVAPFSGFREDPIRAGESLTSVMRNFVVDYNEQINRKREWDHNPVNVISFTDGQGNSRPVFFNEKLQAIGELDLGKNIDALNDAHRKYMELESTLPADQERDAAIRASNEARDIILPEIMHSINKAGTIRTVSLDAIVQRQRRREQQASAAQGTPREILYWRPEEAGERLQRLEKEESLLFTVQEKDGSLFMSSKANSIMFQYPGTKYRVEMGIAFSQQLGEEALAKMDAMGIARGKSEKGGNTISIRQAREILGSNLDFNVVVDWCKCILLQL